MPENSKETLQRKVSEENIRLHAEQAEVYQLLNPQLYNFYNRRKIRCEVNFIMKQLVNNKVVRNRILDLGCGTGFLALPFMQAGVDSITAVDISTQMLKVFETKIPKDQRTRVEIINSEVIKFVRDSLTKETRYEVVAMSALLHHLVDIEEFVKSSCQLVRPGGFFYVAFEPLKQEISSEFRFFWHRVIRALDETLFHIYLRMKGVEPEKKGIADYQFTLGGIEPHRVIDGLGNDFEIISLNKCCVRRSGILAFISGSIVRSENTFSLIARREVS